MNVGARLAWYLAVVGVIITEVRPASAFPANPVIDSFWSESMPWVEIPDRGSGTLVVDLSLNTPSCDDPVTMRSAAAGSMCPSAAARDVIVHVFAEGTAAPNELVVWRCQTATCNWSITLPTAVGPRFAVMVHGGPLAMGRQTGTLQWSNGTASATPALSFAGNLVADVSNPPATNYDAETVLMPDVGNTPNDDLGADVTEVWVLREDFRVIRGDVAGTGVGDAGRVVMAATAPAGSSDVPRWILARPWRQLPFQLRSGDTLIPSTSPAPVMDPHAITNTGRMRLLLNARYGGSDADYDGLSNAIEQSLGTCDGINAFAGTVRCTLWSSFTAVNGTPFMDPRDTDGDGLSDAAEVLGSDYSYARTLGANGRATNSMQFHSGIGETFPRWSFNPRHKDILVEVDMGIALGNCTDTAPQAGCYVDPVTATAVTIPQRLTPAAANIRPLAEWMNSLRDWHDQFATLPANRVNNPDGVDGINVHFDIRAAAGATNGHGTRASFNPYPGVPGTSGLIVYIPGNETSGSTCSCGGMMSGPSPRHGGYATLATLEPQGGGQSGCGSYVQGGLEEGRVPAHEHGHYLGLAHGGPFRGCSGNPFSPFARVSDPLELIRLNRGIENSFKLIHDSIMSYGYDGRPFIVGARSITSLPRSQGSGIGYPETRTFLGRDTASLASWNNSHSRPQARPVGCGTASTPCTDGDFDLDGVAAGVTTTSLAEAPGHWRAGNNRRVSLESYWCTSENFAQNQGFCCATSARPNAATVLCADGSSPSQPTAAATWLLSTQPAGFVGENRAYAIFADDDLGSYGSSAAETRSRTVYNSTRPSGILRWAALDGFARSTGQRVEDCLLVEGCPGVATGPVMGTVRVDNQPVAIVGTAAVSAATYRADSGTEANPYRVTVLGWVARNTRACPNQAACDGAWGAPRLAIARASNVESGFASLTLPGSAPQLTRASSIAIASWDPTMGGRDQGFTVMLRGADSPYDVRWYTCWSFNEDPTTVNCTDRGNLWEAADGVSASVQSFGSIALAVDRPSNPMQQPSLYLLRTRRVIVGMNQFREQLALSRLRVMPGYVWVDGPINPTQTAGYDFITSWQDSSVSMTIVPTTGLEASDRGGRMLIAWEWSAGGPHISARLATRAGIPRSGLTDFAFDGFDAGEWDYSNTPIVTVGSATATWSSRPGHVDALFYDDRAPAVVRGADTDLDPVLTRRARGFHVAMAQNRVTAEFFSVDEPVGHLLPKRSYDDVATLAYLTCQHTGWNQLADIGNQSAVAGAARGWDVVRNASQSGVTVPPLRCPSALAWPSSNAAIANSIGSLDQGVINNEALSADAMDAIAAFIDRENVFSSTNSSPSTPPGMPAVGAGNACYSDSVSMVYAGAIQMGSPP